MGVAVVLTLLFLVLGGTLAYAGRNNGVVTANVPFDSFFNHYTAKHGVPKRLMVAIVAHESNFNPRAVNHEAAADKRKGYDVDSLGLCQILYPDTATRLRPGITRERCLEVDTNIDLGCEVLAYCLRRWPGQGGFPSDAVAAYNAGVPRLNPDGSYSNAQYVNAVRSQWERFAHV